MAELYNTLPTLADAEERFTHREQIFVACRSLLAKYENNFGICLVHAHCNLSDGEIMLARGNVSQPEKISKLAEYYPERWLSSGTPYEFTTRLTTAPPVALVEAFNQLTVQLGVLDLVGELPGMLPRMLPGLLPSSSLYHIDKGENKPGKMIEHTEGRMNFLMPYTDGDRAHLATQTETAWDLGNYDPVTMTSNTIVVCDSRTTRKGATHKGTKSEYHQEFDRV
ncbi:hypothetical protein MMC10_006523 [Thelotrema lepadinum]|nr:hypothetical protein [Thelotrema lepadinum]